MHKSLILTNFATCRGQSNVTTTLSSQLKTLNEKSEYISCFRKDNLQENIEKSIHQRLSEERMKLAEVSFTIYD